MSDYYYIMTAIKRRWVPEWLYALFGRLGIAGKWPLRWVLNRRLSEFEERLFNGR